METILGFVMMYAWVHSVVVITKKVKDVSTYETVVLITGATGFLLYVIGTL